jgi:hypothetical protein
MDMSFIDLKMRRFDFVNIESEHVINKDKSEVKENLLK